MNEENVTVIEEKVPVKSKLWFCSADCLSTVLNSLLTGGAMTYYFTKILGLSEELASTVWLIFGIWNAINDPIFGYISDRTKSKLGRRIPYIRYGSIFYAIAFIAVWWKWPIGDSQTALFAQMLVSLFLFDALYTAIATSLYVLPFTMVVTNKARGNLMIWKLCFSIVSMGVPMVVYPIIKPDVGDDTLPFRLIMTGIGVLAFIVIFFSTFFYKEKVQNESEEQYGIIKSMVTVFKNKAFIVFEVLSFSLVFIQTVLLQGIAYYFDEFDTPMVMAYGFLGAGAVLGIILWLKKFDSWGIKTSLSLMSIVFSVTAAAICFVGEYKPVALVAFFLAGGCFAGSMYLVPLMMGDIVDYDEHLTGMRREGMYAGVNSLITKPAISFANASFLMIAKKIGYDITLKAGQQSAAGERGVLVAWMAVPAILLLFCFISLRFYPLAGEKWKNIKAEIALKHSDKD